ncbi:SDR family NAD(P)-dependent oxidoreductase [Pseudovibrio sp. WM33]|uniref:SDR family NAD(P)-dependent oxidoreductase n=1 Tax=Pseudovibrio sp. WM33 TaxID=1735585 RepID=UPI0007AEE342|nr:SDR family NAD(P)-dependent oxidoreductase [Pseudovibrio sp. WM33]KZL25975.1 3-oxoacyl-[acyl-carrier-protein] reductase FabG [Pseudovibrio sp. WM33]
MARRALITGGNRGIGYAIAKGLKKEGLEVIIGSRNAEAGAEAAKQLDCGHVHLDVADLRSIEQAFDDIGIIDVLVNNAGVLYEEPMLENPAQFEQSMQVMVHGPYHLIRRAAPAMIDRQYGRIVNMSSNWGAFTEGLAGPGAYGVAKAALNALTLALSRELPSCVKINSMCPGWVATRMGGETAPRTPEQGAETGIWLATLPEAGPNGGFFSDYHPMGW